MPPVSDSPHAGGQTDASPTSPRAQSASKLWEQAQGLPHGGTYHGLDEVRRNIFDPLDVEWWDEFTAVPDEFLDAGDEVVVLGRYRGVAKETGKRLDVPFVHIWTIREEQAVRFRQFLDTAGWVEALRI